MVDRIRVLFLLGSLGGGGSERQVLQILQRLDRAIFQPLLYAVYREGELLESVPHDVPLHCYWDRHSFPRLRFPGRIALQQSLDLARVLRRERVDVLCERNFEMTLLAAGACWFRPTPRVAVVSADPTLDVPLRSRRFATLKHRFLRQAYRAADRVVAVSNGVRQSVCQYYGLPPERVVTLYNAIDLQRIDQQAEAFQPPFEEGRFHVVSVGGLRPEKGLNVLIDALHLAVHERGLGDLRLWILGTGPLEGELRAQVRTRRLEAHVSWAGFQPNPLPYVRHAHLFCLPSLYEGLPNALAEAMACRTPVLATDCPSGPREMLAGGQYGRLVPPADPAALAEAIADAVTHHNQWRMLTGPARQHVESQYSSEIGIPRYEKLLAEVAMASRDAKTPPQSHAPGASAGHEPTEG